MGLRNYCNWSECKSNFDETHVNERNINNHLKWQLSNQNDANNKPAMQRPKMSGLREMELELEEMRNAQRNSVSGPPEGSWRTKFHHDCAIPMGMHRHPKVRGNRMAACALVG